MVESTAAEREAETNWNNNLAALRVNQPAAAEILDPVEVDIRWIFARDGSLTAMDHDGKWWGGCSVPLLAGESILKTLETAPTGSCLLAPAHAGLVWAARQRMGSWPVLFVVQPDLQIARMILSCHDFSDQISRHRLWLVCGEDWPQQLRQLLDDHPGLGHADAVYPNQMDERRSGYPDDHHRSGCFLSRAEPARGHSFNPAIQTDPHHRSPADIGRRWQ